MIHHLRSLQWRNILLIILVTIFSEYLIEFILFGHVIGSGYTLYSVLLHILYYLAIPSVIVASELWKRQAKKLVQYLALIVPTLIHVVLHIVPFLQLLHIEWMEDDHTSDTVIIEENHDDEEDHHHDIYWYWYIFAIILISLQVYAVETLLRRLPLDHRSIECDDICDH